MEALIGYIEGYDVPFAVIDQHDLVFKAGAEDDALRYCFRLRETTFAVAVGID